MSSTAGLVLAKVVSGVKVMMGMTQALVQARVVTCLAQVAAKLVISLAGY
jgi:hypothetical protein